MDGKEAREPKKITGDLNVKSPRGYFYRELAILEVFA